MRKVMTGTVWWLLVAIICGLIFMFSAQNASVSSDTSEKVINSVIPREEVVNKDSIKFKIILSTRKIAHFIIFAALGFCAMGAANCTFKKASILIVLLFCFLYACTDEIHQLFVDGRTGKFIDVLLDTVGSAFGLGCYLLIIKIKKVVSLS